METQINRRPLIAAGVLLGIGMGGFVDGILFHQILQLHNMMSNRLFPDTLVNIEVNMFWDGLFHAFTWLTTALGLGLLWKAAGRKEVPHATRSLTGSLFLGWGVFNFIEGIVDHLVIQIHHVVQRATGTTQLAWDLAFLASGLFFMAIGGSLIRKDRAFEKGTRDFRAAA